MLLTIFTPTYNRGYIIHKLYESLCNQTCQDFEWLIIDDGSTDNTADLIKLWTSEKIIKIKYLYQENQGKMQAHNTAVLQCNTKLFLCVDSDDYISKDTVKDIVDVSHKLKEKNIAGIISYRGISENTVIKNEFPKYISKSSLGELYSAGFKGDTSLTFRTEILKRYLFPKISTEKFITEAFIYDQIDIKYKYLILRKIHIICEYRNDGYTKNMLYLMDKYPIGWMLYYNQRALFEKDLVLKLKYWIQYLSFALFNRLRLKLIRNKIIFLLLPFSCILKFRRLIKADSTCKCNTLKVE